MPSEIRLLYYCEQAAVLLVLDKIKIRSPVLSPWIYKAKVEFSKEISILAAPLFPLSGFKISWAY